MSDETLDDALENGSESASESENEINEFDQLVLDVENDPGCASFPRLAEAYRRNGQIVRAREVAEAGLALSPERLGGRVALALAQLDVGDVQDAIVGLSSILENIPEIPAAPEVEEAPSEHRLYATPLAQPSPQLPQVDLTQEGEDSAVELRVEEIDSAFDHAQAEADQMMSPNDVAEAAMLDADIPDTSEQSSTNHEAAPEPFVADDPNEPYVPVEHPVFATETMANLLEGQGDTEGAEAIRSRIPTIPISPSTPEVTERSYNEMFAYSSGNRNDTPAALDEVEAEPIEPTMSITESSEEIELDDVGHSAQEHTEEDRPALVELEAETDDDVVQDIQDARAERRARIVTRLEGWLANIRRDVA